MVIVKLMGGLGNQMFQYAMARRVSHHNHVPLKLDLSWFSKPGSDTPRAYELKHLSIREVFATDVEIAELIRPAGFRKFAVLVNRSIAPYYKQTHVREQAASFDPHLMTLPAEVYIEGYWGSEKYFSDIGDIVKKEFTLRKPSNKVNEKMAELIRSVESVSIHVRRGDFVTSKVTNQFHGVCSIAYYQAAVKMIAASVKRPRFFVFSDDQEWVKQNIKTGYPTTYVSHNGVEAGHEDLRLMSLCKHNIIANSTFSWWGAWLNANPNKKVIAPLKWFADESADTRDLTPDSWKRL